MRAERSLGLLSDIRQAAGAVRDHLAGATFERFRGDRLLRAAVEREFITIGEAVSQLSRSDAETAARITLHRRIIAFRNILVHGYRQVDAAEV